MGWNRSATLLSVIVFTAFSFMVIGVFSDPISKNTLSIASKDGYYYGILGHCTSGDGDAAYKCSEYGLGYSLNGSSWPSGAETITKAFIVHIIAAGLLLISLILALFSHFRNSSFWIVVAVFLLISCIASALAFALELYVFKTKLKFSGWFGLPAAVLSLWGGISMLIMHRRLKAKLGLTSVTGKDAFLNDPVGFQNGFGFHPGRDDEKLLKSNANVSAIPLSTPFGSSKPSDNQSSLGSSRTNLGSQGAYQKIPEKGGSSTTLPVQNRIHPLPLPVSNSTGNVGAIPNQQPISRMQDAQQKRYDGANANAKSQPMRPSAVQNSMNARPINSGGVRTGAQGAALETTNGITRGGEKALPNNAIFGNAVSGNAAAAATAGAVGAGAAIGGAAGAAGLAGSAANNTGHSRGNQGDFRGNNGDASNNLAVPRSQRQETWSQVALKKARENNTLHASNASIATTQAPHVPAGQYLNGVDRAERFGPNVVQIPKLRTGEVPVGESATIEYHKDETQTKSPLSRSKIPNYSRISAQDPSKIPAMKSVSNGPTPDRSYQAASKPEALPAPGSHIRAPSSDSKSSYYSDRLADGSGRVSPIKPSNDATTTAGASTNQSGRTPATHYGTQYDYNQYDPNQYAQYSQQQYAQQYAQQPTQQYSQYAQQYAPHNQYNQYAQAGYYNYSGNQDPTSYAQSYNYQQQPNYSQSGYNGAAGYQSYGHPSPLQAGPNGQYQGHNTVASRTPKAQRSDIALMSNPDFSVGEIGKRRLPNRRP